MSVPRSSFFKKTTKSKQTQKESEKMKKRTKKKDLGNELENIKIDHDKIDPSPMPKSMSKYSNMLISIPRKTQMLAGAPL